MGFQDTGIAKLASEAAKNIEALGGVRVSGIRYARAGIVMTGARPMFDELVPPHESKYMAPAKGR